MIDTGDSDVLGAEMQGAGSPIVGPGDVTVMLVAKCLQRLGESLELGVALPDADSTSTKSPGPAMAADAGHARQDGMAHA